MKDRLKALGIPILLVLTTFFSYGCTATQRKELMDEVGTYVKAEGVKILVAAKEKAAEVAAAKIAEVEKKKLVELDANLAPFKVKDPLTGAETQVTWKHFDADKDGALSPSEMTSASVFVATELMKKVASGEMSKDEAAKTGKSVGLSLAALLALWGAGKGVSAVAGKGKKNGDSPPSPPADPAQPDPNQPV